MRAFFVFVLFFLAFLLFASNGLGDVDLTPNTPEVAHAAAPISPQPLVITIQESPISIPPNAAIVPVTGGCANPYIVQRGDWLLKIAANCDTSLAAILQANPQIINENLIYPDQLITMSNAVAIAPIPVTGLVPTIQSEVDLQVRAINFLPNTLVDVAIGPESVGYTVVTSGITDANGNLTTHITVPNAPDSQIPWVVVVATTSNPRIQAKSRSFYIK